MKFSAILFLGLILLLGCQPINKVLKSTDPQYKLRMAEQYFANKKYNLAQQVYEDIMPAFVASPNLRTSITSMLTLLITSAIT
jgi:outer membrane protein assembly factor BamD